MILKYYSQGDLPIKYGTDGAAGLDLPFYDPDLESVTLQPGESRLFKTGVHIEFPIGYYGDLDTRSSTSKLKLDLLCHTIDEDYRGNIRLSFINLNQEPVTITRGEYLAQIIIKQYQRVIPVKVPSRDHLNETNRGSNGFGSSGGNQAAKETSVALEGVVTVNKNPIGD